MSTQAGLLPRISSTCALIWSSNPHKTSVSMFKKVGEAVLRCLGTRNLGSSITHLGQASTVGTL